MGRRWCPMGGDLATPYALTTRTPSARHCCRPGSGARLETAVAAAAESGGGCGSRTLISLARRGQRAAARARRHGAFDHRSFGQAPSRSARYPKTWLPMSTKPFALGSPISLYTQRIGVCLRRRSSTSTSGARRTRGLVTVCETDAGSRSVHERAHLRECDRKGSKSISAAPRVRSRALAQQRRGRPWRGRAALASLGTRDTVTCASSARRDE